MYDAKFEKRRQYAMSIREAAARLGVSQALLWKLIRKGDVAVVRLGGRTLGCRSRAAATAWRRRLNRPPLAGAAGDSKHVARKAREY